jgi:hypothetical protein
MDVGTASVRNQRVKRSQWFRVAAIAGLVLLCTLLAIDTGHWRDLLVTAAWGSCASGVWYLEVARLRRVADRRARALEQRARALGLTPTASDARVHEGDGEQGHVRVWIEQPPMLHDTGSVITVTSWAWFAFGMGLPGCLAAMGVLAGAVLLSVWTSRRPQINVEWVTETGSLHQVEVHRSADVDAALDRAGLEGALGFSDSDTPAGRIGIAAESGGLNSPEGEE